MSSDEVLNVMGVPIVHTTLDAAVQQLLDGMAQPGAPTKSVYFVNAHSLNVATADAEYRRVLQAGSAVFGDGTGVRWAVRCIHGIRLKDNVNGTDLVPALFRSGAGRGYGYYLLGATEQAIERAAKRTQELFPGWRLAGHHHGYLDRSASQRVVAEINGSGAELLLVGMGNPLQEKWIHRHQSELRVAVAMGVGGLFSYWSGDLVRAPKWLRNVGHEWLHLLVSQPHKFKRYLLGNPLFLARMLRVAADSRTPWRGIQ